MFSDFLIFSLFGVILGPIGLFYGWRWGPKIFLGFMYIDYSFCFLSFALISFFHVVWVCGGVVVFGDYRVSPNFLLCWGSGWGWGWAVTIWELSNVYIVKMLLKRRKWFMVRKNKCETHYKGDRYQFLCSGVCCRWNDKIN